MESLYGQVRVLDAELIVGIRDGGLPSDAYPGVIRIVEPRGTLFSLRAAAFERARGRVVAMTEDHCRVRPDWCESVVKVHAERPEVRVIIGCVENTARARRSEWAAYLLGNGAFMSPLGNTGYGGAVTSANVSFKRGTMPERLPDFGWSGDWYAEWLKERSEPVVLDSTPVVDHELEISMRDACAVFYRSARASTGLRMKASVTRTALGGLWGLACTPVNAVRTGLRVAVHKGRFRTAAIISIPAVALLMMAHNYGVIRAAIGGPGNAPHLLS